jgi:uncharacterized protein YjbI with pentapeptide repeats
MDEVDLPWSILLGANASGVRLWESNLQAASFNSADLRGASFRVADTTYLRGANSTSTLALYAFVRRLANQTLRPTNPGQGATNPIFQCPLRPS